MVGGHAEVGEDCVHLFDVMIPQEILQIAEVAAYKGEVGIIDDIPFGILVLIESQQGVKESRANALLLRR